MTARDVRWCVFKDLAINLITLSLIVGLGVLLVTVPPEGGGRFVIWAASIVVALHTPFFLMDAWQCIQFLTLKAGEDHRWPTSS